MVGRSKPFPPLAGSRQRFSMGGKTEALGEKIRARTISRSKQRARKPIGALNSAPRAEKGSRMEF